MERRTYIRKPLHLPAVIRYPCKGRSCSFRTITRDLSFEGAFIDTGDFTLQGSIIRMEVEACSAAPLVIDALVVRSDTEGLGLLFAYYSSEVFEQLALLLEPESYSGISAAPLSRRR